MNKTLYSAAMDRITMSEQCENSILEAVMSTVPVTGRKRGKIRFIPVLAAAAILVTGTATAAADGFEWIKGLFADDSFYVTNEIAAMTTEMNAFSCESEDENIQISPVGTIADNSAIYCLLRVDNTSDDFDYRSLRLADVRVNDICFDRLGSTAKDIYGNEKEGWSFGYGMDYKDDNTLAVKIEANYKAFKEADKITIKLAKVPFENVQDCEPDTIITDDSTIENFADVNFYLSIGNINYLDINYNTSRIINVGGHKIIAENICVTPLRVMINGKTSECVSTDHPLSQMKDIIIKLKDGSEVTASRFGGGSHAGITSDGYSYDRDWPLESPVDPDSISTIYIDDVCLYDCNAQ